MYNTVVFCNVNLRLKTKLVSSLQSGGRDTESFSPYVKPLYITINLTLLNFKELLLLKKKRKPLQM
jgi:hypothetical protein